MPRQSFKVSVWLCVSAFSLASNPSSASFYRPRREVSLPCDAVRLISRLAFSSLLLFSFQSRYLVSFSLFSQAEQLFFAVLQRLLLLVSQPIDYTTFVGTQSGGNGRSTYQGHVNAIIKTVGRRIFSDEKLRDYCNTPVFYNTCRFILQSQDDSCDPESPQYGQDANINLKSFHEKENLFSGFQVFK